MPPGAKPKPPAPPARCRVWIIEDHLSIRQLLQGFVSSLPGFAVAGSSPDAAPALRGVRAGQIDLVILDLMIQGGGGIGALLKFRGETNPPRVVIYSATATMHSLQLALSHGATGYVAKTDSLEELGLALKRVRAGGTHLSPDPARLLVSSPKPRVGVRKTVGEVELGVLAKLARGTTVKGTALDLGLSLQKVYRVRQTLMERSGARTPQDLTRYAIEMGLVSAHRSDLG